MPNQNSTATDQENLQQIRNILNSMSINTLIATAPACIGSLFPTFAAPALGAACIIGSIAALIFDAASKL